jgi:ABC-2 type transport system ATP-binding protein
MALAKRPKLLVLDEPVASLDPLARREFMQTLMTAVADEDITVLLSSHNVSELERVCDRLIVITGGRIQLDGDIDALLAEHRLLTGPSNSVVSGPGVIHVTRGDRHVNVVVRIGQGSVMPGWESHPIGLEELVLAYLRLARLDQGTPRGENAKAVRT